VDIYLPYKGIKNKCLWGEGIGCRSQLQATTISLAKSTKGFDKSGSYYIQGGLKIKSTNTHNYVPRSRLCTSYPFLSIIISNTILIITNYYKYSMGRGLWIKVDMMYITYFLEHSCVYSLTWLLDINLKTKYS